MIVGEEGILIKDLYYILMKNNLGNVKECKTLIKHKHVVVNGGVVDNPMYQVHHNDAIYVDEKKVNSQPFVYYMLNKPKGYVCANFDKHYPCVVDLVDKQCKCIGRLDKETTGLLLLTNDVSIIKKLLLPDNHIEKTYYVTTKNKLDKSIIKKFEEGVIIDKNIKCRSSKLEIIDENHCYVTIYEGKYHQIKKMFLSCFNEVKELKRISFGNLLLDEHLKEGEYRQLTKSEFHKMKEQCLL